MTRVFTVNFLRNIYNRNDFTTLQFLYLIDSYYSPRVVTRIRFLLYHKGGLSQSKVELNHKINSAKTSFFKLN